MPVQLLKKLSTYCEDHTVLPVKELEDLERETHLKTLSPQMLSGKVQGQLLYLLTCLLSPGNVLEIGTFTGYATICMAKALPAGGMVHTIEINPEMTVISKKYFEKTGLERCIRQHIGDAKTIVPTMPGPFDLVFIDAAKNDYECYYDLVIGKVRQGGLIIADNVLWGGKVVSKLTDNDTRLMKAFNEKVHDDKRVENLMLPIRDGLLLARKK
ncbi:MAG: O-methyltransferase [Saprospiraceae bacterium]|nr:O-methyltransferase [Saprospiraceae bacterium]